jgi:hypothetical protein
MGLSVAFDLPTQIGYDSDHALAAGEVGAWVSPSIRSRTWSCCSTDSARSGLDLDDDQRDGDHPAGVVRRRRETSRHRRHRA